MNPKVSIISLGCSKNLVDSEKIINSITRYGGLFCEDKYDADVIVVNTCGFINAAKEESIDAILQTAQLKEEGNCKKLIVTGCLAERYKDDLLNAIPEIDELIGIDKFDKITEKVFFEKKIDKLKPKSVKNEKLVKKSGINVKKNRIKLSSVSKDKDAVVNNLVRLTPKHYAYLKISEGCNHHCTYCTIPAIRGKHKSCSIEEIVDEAELLAANGVKELNIIAQDTTIFGTDIYKKQSLHILLNKLSAIKPIKWIRLLYAHPAHIYDELIDEISSNKKICNYLDLPIQHINNDILKKMGRNTTKEHITQLIENLRRNIPDIILRTSIIVGFPGETEKKFQELVEFVKSMEFDRLGTFVYSREDDTLAAKYNGHVSARIKNERFATLMSTQQEIVFKNNEKMVNKELNVLIDGNEDLSNVDNTLVDEEVEETPLLPQNNNIWFARSYADAPEVDNSVIIQSGKRLRPGTFKKVTIIDTDGYNLIGEL